MRPAPPEAYAARLAQPAPSNGRTSTSPPHAVDPSAASRSATSRSEHTVLDCADLGSTSTEEAIDLIARACSQRLTTPRAIGAALAGRARHRRRDELADVLTDVRAGAESVLEVRFLRGVLRPHGLPVGVGQHGTAAGRHDGVFRGQRLIVELDGRDPNQCKVTRATIAIDVGKPINPSGIEQQALGCLAEAISLEIGRAHV